MNELEIKAALADWLIDSRTNGYSPVFINELPFSDFLRKGSSTRRADFVVVGRSLHAYEIKSDGDNLKRLPGQIEAYNKYFNTLTIVTVAKHTKEIKEIAGVNTGILEINHTELGCHFTPARIGRPSISLDLDKYLSFLDKVSLFKALKEHGIKCHRDDSRESLYLSAKAFLSAKASQKHIPELMALRFLKNRYRETHDRFILNRSPKTQVGDLKLLSRNYVC